MTEQERAEIGKVIIELELALAKLNVYTDHLTYEGERTVLFRMINTMNREVFGYRKLLRDTILSSKQKNHEH